MNRFAIAAFVAACVTCAALSAAEGQGTELTSTEDQLSYLIGQEVGETIKQMDTEVNMDVLVRGLKDSLEGRPSLLSEEQAQAVRQAYARAQAQKFTDRGDKNKADGQAFLDENKEKPGVVTTDSGLQYEVLTEGQGATPKATDTVTVHYRGTLIDGTEFDSSYRREQPATFPVGGVIAGWTEGLQRMKIGGKYRLTVPADLAYGERGAGRLIGPNATLVFEVELLGIAEPVAE